jgi:hypothetical protein
MAMSQPGSWWQRYGTLAQMAQAAVALLGFVAIRAAGLREDLKTASITPPDCKLGKT